MSFVYVVYYKEVTLCYCILFNSRSHTNYHIWSNKSRANFLQKSFQVLTGFKCIQPFSITLLSSQIDWNTVDEDIKPLIIHPSTYIHGKQVSSPPVSWMWLTFHLRMTLTLPNSVNFSIWIQQLIPPNTPHHNDFPNSSFPK